MDDAEVSPGHKRPTRYKTNIEKLSTHQTTLNYSFQLARFGERGTADRVQPAYEFSLRNFHSRLENPWKTSRGRKKKKKKKKRKDETRYARGTTEEVAAGKWRMGINPRANIGRKTNNVIEPDESRHSRRSRSHLHCLASGCNDPTGVPSAFTIQRRQDFHSRERVALFAPHPPTFSAPGERPWTGPWWGLSRGGERLAQGRAIDELSRGKYFPPVSKAFCPPWRVLHSCESPRRGDSRVFERTMNRRQCDTRRTTTPSANPRRG